MRLEQSSQIKEIGKIAHDHGVLFHTDAVQAFGHIPIDVEEMNIDMLSASGHKINGPKGIGVMYIRKGVKIRSFIHGGAQERKRRAGTHNVPGIVGIGTAAKLAKENMEERSAKEIATQRSSDRACIKRNSICTPQRTSVPETFQQCKLCIPVHRG